MNNLYLVNAIRPGKANQAERRYLDFVVDKTSLKTLLGQAEADLITPVGWGDANYNKHILRVLRLQERSELSTGRVMIYVCPECGDIECGAITACIEDRGDKIMWKDFGYETGYGGLTEIYPGIEPMEFDRQNYFNAFSRI